MRTFIAAVLLLSSSDLLASCLVEPQPPPVTFKLESCQAISLSSSPSRTRHAGGRAPLHIQGAEEKGILIAGTPSNPGLLTQLQYYLVAGSAEQVCPSQLPATVSLEIESRCCDVVPAKIGCIAPFPSATIKILVDDT